MPSSFREREKKKGKILYRFTVSPWWHQPGEIGDAHLAFKKVPCEAPVCEVGYKKNGRGWRRVRNGRQR